MISLRKLPQNFVPESGCKGKHFSGTDKTLRAFFYALQHLFPVYLQNKVRGHKRTLLY